ncbi:MAG TPA: ABC transporter substrate-binding protein [Clostridiaceae bacterium]|nr:ABC transporter substrate-binding protein [Clostridiaceae bacterium]
MKRMKAVLILLTLIFLISGCSGSNKKGAVDRTDFGAVLAAAKGTTVNFYGWGGSELTNKWIDNYLAKYVKENYDIKINRVPMDIDQILNKMIGEKQANVKKGSVDLVWINGENFNTAMKNDLLFGPFTDYLPNYEKYVDVNSDEVKYDFGYEINGFEAPYGKAQFVFINNPEATPQASKSAEELLEYAKNYKGRVTYPAPPDFTGSAFVRNIIYDIVGYDMVKNLSADKEEVYNAIKPAIDYLKELKPYLWKEGKTYPSTIAQLDNMYADGEVIMTMSYNPNHVAAMIQTGQFPESSQSFIFDKGTIGNTHFLAIPANAANIDGALAVINAVLTPQMQASKYVPENWGDLPVVDMNKLNEEEKELFTAVKIGKGVLPPEELLSKRVGELKADVVPIIEEIWQEEIMK